MSTANVAPPSSSIINLAIADLTIYAILLFPTIFLTWKHGKDGMVCWPIFLSFFGLRFTSDVYQIIHKTDPLEPNTVAIMTNAGSLACLSLTIIGILYEVNIILPVPRRWTEKIILGVTHLANTAGIGLATYGGAPSATGKGGVAAENLNQIGNCLMLFVMFTICWWMWPTWQRISALEAQHPAVKPAKILFFAAAGAMPFQLVRLAYNTTYAFYHITLLDPITGTFAVRLILLFVMQLAVAAISIAGGLWGVPPKWKRPDEEEEEDATALQPLPRSRS